MKNVNAMQITRIQIDDMTCAGCVASTQRALQKVRGVHSVDVSLAEGRATVEHDDEVSAQKLLSAVEEAGYEAAIESK